MVQSVKVRRPVATLLLLAVCLLLPACGKTKVTKANFDKINNGMSLAEVEAILGKGTKEEGGDGTNVAAQAGVAIDTGPAPKKIGDTYVWEKGDKKITVVIYEGKVTHKQPEGL